MTRGWIHDLVLEKPGQRLRDDRARTKIIGDPIPFRGRIAFRSATRAEVAGGKGENDLVTVQMPHAMRPNQGDTVVAEGLLGRDQLLNGRWLVDAVSSGPAHARCLCSRTDPAQT